MRTCLGLTTNPRNVPSRYECVPLGRHMHAVVIAIPANRRDHFAAVDCLATALDPFLPFGPGSGALDDIAATITRDTAPWRDALAKLTGCAELVATATWQKSVVTGSGKGWLRARANQERSAELHRETVWDHVSRALTGAGVPVRSSRQAPFSGGVDFSLLIRRSDVERAVSSVEAIGLDGISVSASGPWPCFSFGPRTDGVPA